MWVTLHSLLKYIKYFKIQRQKENFIKKLCFFDEYINKNVFKHLRKVYQCEIKLEILSNYLLKLKKLFFVVKYQCSK